MILDSNILIYFVDPAYESLRSYLSQEQITISISAITKLEVMGFHRLRPVDKEALEDLLVSASVLPITGDVIEEAIRLRRQRKRSLGDSIIAATALLYDLPLLTNNEADFKDIARLTVMSMASVLA
jgi:toxin FitB